LPVILPFDSFSPFYTFSTTIEGADYVFKVRWNNRDKAWYFDVLETDGTTPIAQGLKINLGVIIGRWCRHKLFRTGIIVAVDLSDAGRDATVDDLGTRVVVQRWTTLEALSHRVLVDFPDPAVLAEIQEQNS